MSMSEPTVDTRLTGVVYRTQDGDGVTLDETGKEVTRQNNTDRLWNYVIDPWGIT
jgi:hypothetical protein